MIDHELSDWHPATLLQDDHGGSEPVQLGNQPGNLVLADLQSIYQVVFTSHPDRNEVDEIGDEGLGNHLPGFETC